MPKQTKPTTTTTTVQTLGALLKSARDIMRKDIRLRQGYGGRERINGEFNRLPRLTRIMFLEVLDDLDVERNGKAKLAPKLDALLPTILDRALKGEP